MLLKTIVLIFFLFIILSPSFVLADERILSFHSEITVNQDGSLIVEETIKVRAEGNEIKRGVYRDFPTRYRDSFGNNYVVNFALLRIMKNGKPETYHTEYIANGIRIYIGQHEVFLSPGIYKYTIIYSIDRQIGFFKEHDELYWNVTGNYWSFPIDKASATVHLPDDAQKLIKLIDAFTGPLGSRGKDFKITYDQRSVPTFETTRVLGVGEGLTIVAGWQKGFINEPTTQAKAKYFISGNMDVIISFFGFCLICIYYLLSWTKVGRDPKKDIIFPLYEPPKGYSPASMRFIYKMGYDDKSFASALISMAVKGVIQIKDDNGTYTIEKTKKDFANLTADEKSVFDALFSKDKRVELDTVDSKTIKKAITGLKSTLKNSYEKIYFFSNKGYFLAGAFGSLFIAGASIFTTGGAPDSVFLSVWLTFWSVGVTFLLIELKNTWKAVRYSSKKFAFLFKAIFLSIFSIPFIGAEIFIILALLRNTSPLFALLIVAIGVINYIFYHILKAPTLRGRKLLDKMEGFRLFLDATERDRLNILNPPERTPELFERYLPYAVALDVENHWAKQFESVLKASTAEGTTGYRPIWYSSSAWSNTSFSSIGSSIGDAIASSVSSASSAGSSSGSGGSSGGGGGGGGGGGW